MKYCISVLLLMSCLFSYGQTVMTVDKTKVVIGDQVKATITTNLTEGREWRNLENVWPDSIPGIEVVSGPEVDTKNPASARYTWNVSVFDTGWVHIPPLTVVIRQGNNIDTFTTTDIPIEVASVEPDSTGLAGIKDIVREPFNLMYYKKYIPHFIVVLLILGALYYWWRRKNRVIEVVEEPIPEPLPHVWALNSLDELQEKRLWQTGEVKEHYTLLTGILREYLERRYGVNALEQTTDEILHQLSYLQLSNDLIADTEQLLSVADLIKFAKADPGVDIHAATIERVRRFVRETMVPDIPEVPTNQNTSDETVE